MQAVRAPEFPSGRPWVRAVMAATLDGAMRGRDGGSRSISTPADQSWFSSLRAAPDVLLVGAGTIRAEDYRPSKKVIAVVSESLDLPASLRMFRDRGPEHPRSIVLTSAAAADEAPQHLREGADVIACGADRVDLRQAVTALHERGLMHVQCEGGPRLLSALIEADLLDELLLSVTPLLHGGEDADHIVSVPGGLTPELRLRLADVQTEEGTAFLRLVTA